MRLIPLMIISIICVSVTLASTPVDCYNHAPERLTHRDAVVLCSGATSIAPIVCFNQASEILPKWNAIVLCSGATSKAPVEGL